MSKVSIFVSCSFNIDVFTPVVASSLDLYADMNSKNKAKELLENRAKIKVLQDNSLTG